MSAANDQIYQLKRMGFTNEEVAEDLRYEKEVVDLVSPDNASASQAIDKLEDLGDSAMRVLEELMNYAENERVRSDAAKFLLVCSTTRKRRSTASTSLISQSVCSERRRSLTTAMRMRYHAKLREKRNQV